MSKITTEEFYRGDKYNVTNESFKLYWKDFKNEDKDEIDDLFLCTVQATVLATIKMLNNGDFISELEFEMKSLLFFANKDKEN